MKLLVKAGLLAIGTGEQISGGWLLSEDGLIAATGGGLPPAADQVLDVSNCVVMPGLVDAHDHFYQWATRGFATNQGLFGWLTALYPLWEGIDEEVVFAAGRAAAAALLKAGCTLASDHHYVFPPGRPGIFEALVAAVGGLGLRFHPGRGSMSLGRSRGGLPPDRLVEDEDAILADTERLISAYHDPAPGSMCRLVVAPCSPFSVTPELMRESAELARRHDLRLHTHLAETLDEERHCLERFGRRPLDLMEEWGWLAPDVWYAHGIHFTNAEIERLGRHRTGIAHCPSSNMRLGAGVCPVAELRAAGAPVGLGVDGSASNEDYDLAGEVRQALLLARLRAAMLGQPEAAATMDTGTALDLATRGGAACLGRDDLGTLEVGRRADLAAYRVDDLAHAAMPDPLEALVLAPPRAAEAVVVEGRIVVRNRRLTMADEEEIRADLLRATQILRRWAGV